MKLAQIGGTVWRTLVAAFLLGSATTAVSRADVVYDNTTTISTNAQGAPFFLALPNEFGDEVELAGSARAVTAFYFEYFGDFTPQGDETARIRFYKNDGPGLYLKPQTVLWDSGNFSITTNYNTRGLLVPRVVVPDRFTWSVQFSGMTMTAGDQAGLVAYNPPTVGALLNGGKIGSYDDFWKNNGGIWSIYNLKSTPVANFGARIIAVPEPASVLLGLSGGAALIWAARRRNT